MFLYFLFNGRSFVSVPGFFNPENSKQRLLTIYKIFRTHGHTIQTNRPFLFFYFFLLSSMIKYIHILIKYKLFILFVYYYYNYANIKEKQTNDKQATNDKQKTA